VVRDGGGHGQRRVATVLIEEEEEGYLV